jgi:hypothetical protein
MGQTWTCYKHTCLNKGLSRLPMCWWIKHKEHTQAYLKHRRYRDRGTPLHRRWIKHEDFLKGLCLVGWCVDDGSNGSKYADMLQAQVWAGVWTKDWVGLCLVGPCVDDESNTLTCCVVWCLNKGLTRLTKMHGHMSCINSDLSTQACLEMFKRLAGWISSILVPHLCQPLQPKATLQLVSTLDLA